MKSKEDIQKENPELYRVAFEKGTERPFTSPILTAKTDGVFVCSVCGQKLFESISKFDSGTGWPSFDEAIPGSVKEVYDDSHGMQRTEVVCSQCGAHLGHVFGDGPTATGKRYCMNGVCLGLEK